VRPILAALGDLIEHDHDYQSECNEQIIAELEKWLQPGFSAHVELFGR
jgi:hypothetical protein